MGNRCGKEEPVIPMYQGIDTKFLPTGQTKSREGTAAKDVWHSEIYFGHFGTRDGVHGIFPQGEEFMHQTPDWEKPGFVHKGTMEIKYGLCIKDRRSCGMISHILIPDELIEDEEITPQVD